MTTTSIRGRCCAVAMLAFSATAPAATLDSFDLDPGSITVSGISSGGYMAQQFHVAYSGIVAGAGIVAGGPYLCAKGNAGTALTDCTTPTALNPPDVAYSIRATEMYASQGQIDAPGNLARSKVWMFSGSKDETVYPIVMDRLSEYYRRYVDASHIAYEKSVPAAHSMVTDRYGASCDHKGDANNPADNYINDCDYDAAGKLLTWLYGPLAPRSTTLHGRLVAFDQGDFIADPASHSMDPTGYAYIPAACDRGARCRVHVAFHGCLQYPARIGDAFYRHAGYNEWADTNQIVVLYPQTTASAVPPVYNPKGCWDWWGYDDPNYATRDGRQMRAVKAMIDRLGAGYDVSRPAAPTAVRVTGTGDPSVSLSWTASRGPRASAYRVYYATSAGTSFALAGTTDGRAATVSGLASGTSYRFVVRTVSRLDAESVDSSSVDGATTGLPSPVPVNAVTLLIP